jgi:protoporphyrin/coproporphyrin ferrochelatase
MTSAGPTSGDGRFGSPEEVRERLDEVSQHYHRFHGVSPINAQNRTLRAALEALLEEQGPRIPVYFGNRNWDPLLPDTLRQMRDDGVERALCFVTSAYSSYSGCRQYREDLAAAREEVGEDAPDLDKMRVYYNHPGFVEPQVDLISEALERLPEEARSGARIVFTTHSIPRTMARHCDYEAQHYETCRLVMEHLDRPWDLVYCSRSGPPHVPWLEPDVNDHLEALHQQGIPGVVVVPVGLIYDHIEVL